MRALLLGLLVLVLGCRPDDVVMEDGVVEGGLQAATETTGCEDPVDTASAQGDPMGHDTAGRDTGGDALPWDTDDDVEDGPTDVQGDDTDWVGTGGSGGPPGGGPQ